MLTVTHAFHRFISDLELTDAERAEAVRQHPVVRDNLRAQFAGVDDTFLTGSYKRRTAIRPLKDIDIFLVLNETTHGNLRSQRPEVCLDRVRGALDRAYQSKVPTRPQGRSVNIVFAGTGIGYDIVPAFVHAYGGYLIPDRERQAWIRTDPKKHEGVCISANQRAGGALNPLIKAAKRWRTQSNTPLGSFHLETMAYEAFSAAPPSYPVGLQRLLGFLAQRVLRDCPEPAGLGAKVDAAMSWSERSGLAQRLQGAADLAQQALALDSVDRVEEAHGIWRRLLGDDYPERGR